MFFLTKDTFKTEITRNIAILPRNSSIAILKEMH